MIVTDEGSLKKQIEALQIELGKVAIKQMRVDDQRKKLFLKIQQLESELRASNEDHESKGKGDAK